jgi:phenylalanyl-tRNA synthetase alpha chain
VEVVSFSFNITVMRQEILDESGIPLASIKKLGNSSKVAWAFGLGLERISMVLNDIPDIRLFWSNDSRFINQFEKRDGLDGPVQFQPFSR